MPRLAALIVPHISIVLLSLSTTATAQGLVAGAPLPFARTAAGDVDGDGIDDYSATVGASLEVFRGIDDTLLPHLTRPASDVYVAIGDLDADGHDDLAVPGTNGVVAVSGATGSTLRSWTRNQATVYGGADYDGDGWGDVMLRWIDNVTPGLWLEVVSGRTGAVLFQRALAIQGWGVLIGDQNGDGHDDIGIIQAGLLYPTFFTWQTEVAYGPSLAVQALTGVNPQFLGDVDGDGASDYVTALQVFSGATNSLLGTLPAGSGCTSLGDLDGDGRDDLQVFHSAADGVYSGATLAPMPGGNGQSAHRLGDLDGDGRVECTAGGALLQWQAPGVPRTSRATTRGASGTTSDGRRPRIKVRGHCGLGHTIHFDVRGASLQSLTFLFAGDPVDIDGAGIGAPGNRLYATLDNSWVMSAPSPGLAQISFAVPNSTSLLSATGSMQAAIHDPAANSLGFVGSNAIDLVIDN